MTYSVDSARDFIINAELPEQSIGISPAIAMGPNQRGGAAQEANEAFDTAKKQATIVGQDVVAFETGTESKFRAAISNASLLAQLVASKKVPDRKDIYGWYDAYFDVLRNIGWVVQDNGFSNYAVKGDSVEVHDEIITVATVLLTPGTAALSLLKTTLESLKKMGEDSPWIKIFGRESTHAEVARFQVSVVSKEPNEKDLLVSMIAFGVEAERTITQVLFFKIKKDKARLKSNSAKVSINLDSIKELAPAIEEKIRSYQKNYIATLPDL